MIVKSWVVTLQRQFPSLLFDFQFRHRGETIGDGGHQLLVTLVFHSSGLYVGQEAKRVNGDGLLSQWSNESELIRSLADSPDQRSTRTLRRPTDVNRILNAPTTRLVQCWFAVDLLVMTLDVGPEVVA